MDVADPDARRRRQRLQVPGLARTTSEDAFEKNIPFALDVAKSAKDPANPVSHLGNEPAELRGLDVRPSSYGDPQDVQVDAKRELGKVTMHYRINGGDEQTAPTKEWKGGEVYGGG